MAYSNEEHWMNGSDFLFQRAAFKFFVQVFQINDASRDVMLSAERHQMSVISASWIRHGSVAANIHVA